MRVVDARRALGVVTLACTLALSGCTPDRPAEPSPSPTPAAQTPSETAQERQERLDYAAAEKSYRTFHAEYERVLRAGGAKEPTKVMKATAEGPYLKTFTTVIQGFNLLGSKHVGKDRIVYVRGGGYQPTSLILETCEDSRRVTTVRKSGHNGKGEVLKLDLEVRKRGGIWRVWNGKGEAVKTCG